MVIYIYRKIEKREKFVYANNIISEIISKKANNKKQRGKHGSSYNFLKKNFFC